MGLTATAGSHPVCRRSSMRLELGYVRVDFRVDPTGAPFIIDVNPNPYLSPDAEDAAAAAQAGLSYQDLIASIVESSLGFSQDSVRCPSTSA